MKQPTTPTNHEDGKSVTTTPKCPRVDHHSVSIDTGIRIENFRVQVSALHLRHFNQIAVAGPLKRSGDCKL